MEGEGGGGSVKILVYKFWTSQKFIFPTIIIFLVFWTGGKNSLDYNGNIC